MGERTYRCTTWNILFPMLQTKRKQIHNGYCHFGVTKWIVVFPRFPIFSTASTDICYHCDTGFTVESNRSKTNRTKVPWYRFRSNDFVVLYDVDTAVFFLFALFFAHASQPKSWFVINVERKSSGNIIDKLLIDHCINAMWTEIQIISVRNCCWKRFICFYVVFLVAHQFHPTFLSALFFL